MAPLSKEVQRFIKIRMVNAHTESEYMKNSRKPSGEFHPWDTFYSPSPRLNKKGGDTGDRVVIRQARRLDAFRREPSHQGTDIVDTIRDFAVQVQINTTPHPR